MNPHPCCQAALGRPRRETLAGRTKGGRRRLNVAGWIVPGAIWALLRKCPACLAAYVAIWTGLGISFSTASYLRTSLLLCVGSMVYLAARLLFRSRKVLSG